MDCLIITGMSGAGKSLTVDVLEDIGYYCVDNMPATLIPRFVELFIDSSSKYKRVAFVVDVRSEGDFAHVVSTTDDLRLSGINANILFLDCGSEKLINRYKETRRRHPLEMSGMGLVDAITEERRLLEPVRQRADYIIDTTAIPSVQLKQHIASMFSENGGRKVMVISINSFGFKYGIPHESDLVFDVRFIKNPYYVPELKDLTGLDDAVRDYVFSGSAARGFISRISELLDFLIPMYMDEGKTSLVVSVGCTGGHHRSVAIAQRLYDDLYKAGHNAIIRHRDILKG